MSEIGDVFAILKEQRKAKKEDNKTASTLILKNEGISFESKNNGYHLIVTGLNGEIFDFWPSTGKFIKRSNSKHGRGVRNLLRECRR